MLIIQIFATANYAGHVALLSQQINFDVTIFDEAGQLLEMDALTVLQHATSQLIFIGDHKQQVL